MKANRGDLIVVEKTTRDYVIGKGSSERVEYEVGIVTNITRDGIVKKAKFRQSDDGHEIPAYWNAKTFLVSRDDIDVIAAAEAAWSNPWPHAPEHNKGKSFDSLDEVKAVLSPHKIKQAA